MGDSGKRWRAGLTVGAVAGVADVALIWAADPVATPWVWLESFLFWSVAGGFVVASESELGPYAHGLLATVLLNLPWYVLLGPAAGTPGIPPLLLMSAAFGSLFGWARGRVRQNPRLA